MPFNKYKQQVPCFFLHGFMGNKQDWKSYLQHEHCPKQSLAINITGHNNTQNEEISLEATFQKILDNIPDTNAHGLHFVGYSLGGRIALQFALSYPQFVQKITLISAHPGLETSKEREKRLQEDHELAKTIINDWPNFLQTWYDAPMWHDFKNHSEFSSHLKSRKKQNPEDMATVLKKFSLGQQTTSSKLRNCPFPIHWITGEKDTKYSNTIKSLAEKNKTITHSILKDAGHACHITHKEEIFDLLFPDPNAP